jgi:hypothetical protein
MPNVLSYADIEGYWIAAGGDPALASTMAAIAYAESSGRADIEQAGQPYATTGWGLWQITPGNSESQYGTDSALFDPLANAKAALAKYKSQGLGAWTTYSDGAYKRYLSSALPKQPTGSTAGTTGTSTASGLTGLVGQASSSLGDVIDFFAAFFRPSTYIRIGAGIAGTVFLILGIICLGREAKGI